MTWAAPPSELHLAADEVHVWRADLAFEANPADLDREERERAARFKFEADRHRFVASHMALRHILSRYLSCPPAALRFETAEHGKPYVPGAPLRFSMSHSRGLALFAVGHCEVGVDVERLRRELDTAALAARFFPAEEARELADAPQSEQTRVFARLWTRREAYLKARGIGIAGMREPAGPEWFIADLAAGEGYAAAVACPAPAPRLSTWEFATPLRPA